MGYNSGHWLFYKVGWGGLFRFCYQEYCSSVHQAESHLSVWYPEEDHHRQWYESKQYYNHHPVQAIQDPASQFFPLPAKDEWCYRSCNACNLINYLIKLFLEYLRSCVVINWIYFIKWRNNILEVLCYYVVK